jgi:hypothetical protein
LPKTSSTGNFDIWDRLMNICLVSQEYPPETAHGGIGSQTYLKAHGLAALGHEVHVISHSTDFALRTYQDGAVYVTRVPGFDEQMPIYAEPVRWLTYSTNVAVALSELCTHVSLDLVDFPEWGGEGYIHLLNQTEWNHISRFAHFFRGSEDFNPLNFRDLCDYPIFEES